MGIAEDIGIKITVPPQSDILEVHPMYGYKEQWRSYWKMKARQEEIQGRMVALDNKIANAQEQRLQLAGAMQSMSYEKNTWLKP
jgi:hypothetical protein